MGRAKKVLNDKQKQEIERLIDEDKNIREIHKILCAESNLDMGENTLYSKITKDLGYMYDKNTKKWDINKLDSTDTKKDDNLSSSEQNNKTQDPEEIPFKPFFQQTSFFEQESYDAKPNTTNMGAASTPKPPIKHGDQQYDLLEKLDKIYKYAHDTTLKVFTLEKTIDNISKKLTQIQKSNVHKKILQYPEEFAQIYTSDTIKTSLNLNEELKNRVLELMKERFSKKGSESKLINAALLLTLYHYAEQEDISDQ